MRPYPIRSLQNNSTIFGNTRDGPLLEKGNLYNKEVSRKSANHCKISTTNTRKIITDILPVLLQDQNIYDFQRIYALPHQ